MLSGVKVDVHSEVRPLCICQAGVTSAAAPPPTALVHSVLCAACQRCLACRRTEMCAIIMAVLCAMGCPRSCPRVHRATAQAGSKSPKSWYPLGRGATQPLPLRRTAATFAACRCCSRCDALQSPLNAVGVDSRRRAHSAAAAAAASLSTPPPPLFWLSFSLSLSLSIPSAHAATQHAQCPTSMHPPPSTCTHACAQTCI